MKAVAVKPAVRLKAVPGYCSTVYRGSKYNAWESVQGSNVHYLLTAWSSVLLEKLTGFAAN